MTLVTADTYPIDRQRNVVYLPLHINAIDIIRAAGTHIPA